MMVIYLDGVVIVMYAVKTLVCRVHTRSLIQVLISVQIITSPIVKLYQVDSGYDGEYKWFDDFPFTVDQQIGGNYH